MLSVMQLAVVRVVLYYFIGGNSAARLAAVAYNTDKTVQCRFKVNISANITGTVA
ncbi:MAG: hypothetical protein Q8R24_00980 [Legionellaceae bacterium]|nr:hypothetical protein [Legionellaceae bacterium]